jgi:hypothetical protein
VAEEPEEVLPQNRVATLRRVEEVGGDQTVHGQELSRGSHPGHGEQDHEGHHQHGPDEERHPVERHARCAILEDGDDQLYRSYQGRNLGKCDRLGVDVGPLAGAELRSR